MEHGTVRLHDATLHFTRWGEGPEVLLAFHGFGQHRGYFGPLAEALGPAHTVYAFDLFFHGQSTWRARNAALAKTRWTELVEAFLRQRGVTRFGLLGFSMGGKFVLATLEALPERVTRVVLLAPDGIKTSFWYSLATYPGWTDRFFRHVTVQPGAFRTLARLFRRLRLVDKGVLRFAESQMNTRAQRLRVYRSWTVFREMRFDLERIATLLNGHQIPFTMYLGQYDRIITRRNMGRLLDRVPHHQLVVLPTGHSRLIADVAAYYRTHGGWTSGQ
jgi:pimeloyl-ACP methyl ester carboxylesterase